MGGDDWQTGKVFKSLAPPAASKMRNFKKEIFGPSVYVTTFKTTREALATNDILYRLCSSLSLEIPSEVRFYIQPKIFSDNKVINLSLLLDQQNKKGLQFF